MRVLLEYKEGDEQKKGSNFDKCMLTSLFRYVDWNGICAGWDRALRAIEERMMIIKEDLRRPRW